MTYAATFTLPRHRAAAVATPRVVQPFRRRTFRQRRIVGAAMGALGLVAVLAIAPPAPRADAATGRIVYPSSVAQKMRVSGLVAPADLSRDAAGATPGSATFVAEGTNEAWAKLVLTDGGWPVSENNVTVFLQWMVRENGTNDWWNRNNPLNNGYGSGGGGGLGRYSDLQVAAQKLAENLHRGSGYTAIVAALASSASPSVTAAAIWASPWSTSHYGDGSRWTTGHVAIVKAPDSAW